MAGKYSASDVVSLLTGKESAPAPLVSDSSSSEVQVESGDELFFQGTGMLGRGRKEGKIMEMRCVVRQVLRKLRVVCLGVRKVRLTGW